MLGPRSRSAPALLGRVVNAFGANRWWEARPATRGSTGRSRPRLSNPLERPRIYKVLETGVRSVDTMLTLGQGQRVGIFFGTGSARARSSGLIRPPR